MKKAFSLVELIVVIGIIGALAATLIASMSGSTESARAAKCLTNLKNLANACQTYGVTSDHHIYPLAFPNEERDITVSHGRPVISYKEKKGWVSWDSEGKYPGGKAQSHQTCGIIGFATEDKKKSDYALTNSCIWTILSQNSEVFVCPEHLKQVGHGTRPTWSYLMNEYFSYKKFGELERADRRLLFSEIPFKSWHSWCPLGNGATDEDNGRLEYPNGKAGKNETIGCNHFSGKNLTAHVAFADGHVEKLRIPYTGSKKMPQIDDSQLRELTEWLCTGEDVSFNGTRYNKMDN